eukprot:1159799-Pelagomonas_calceolata.AAC.2
MQGGPAHAHIFKALEHFTMKGSGKIHVGKWRRNACRLYGFDTQVHSQRVAWLAQSPSLSGSTPVDRRKHKGITPQRAPHKKRLEEIKISCRMHKTYYMLPQRGVTTVWDFQRPDLEDVWISQIVQPSFARLGRQGAEDKMDCHWSAPQRCHRAQNRVTASVKTSVHTIQMCKRAN